MRDAVHGSPYGAFFATVLIVALLPAAAAGQDGDGDAVVPTPTGSAVSAHVAAVPLAVAVPVAAEGSLRIDGVLDEPTWLRATPITEFTQMDPMEGAPATEPTDVRIAYDDEALYVGATLYDSRPVTTRLARRDAGVPDSDFFVVLIDSYHDHQTAYRFATNPSGMKRDEIVSGGGGGGGGFGGGGRGGFGDTSWDPIWELATTVADDGWRVEMRIPFSQLRFSPDDAQTWGLQIERKINRTQERSVFAFTPKLEAGGVARYGHLQGIRGIEAGRRLELLPYMGGRAEYRRIEGVEGVDFADPYRSGSDYYANAGLDLKYRLTSNLTLDATVNPDFGQVETDPAEINLTAYETRFDEKRPFFVEGADILDFGEGGPGGSTGRGPQIFYSRRIGRAPQGSLPDEAVFADVDGSTTILGAAKLTGRTADGWSLGFLEAVADREVAPWVNGAEVPGSSVLEPRTNYFTGRVRRDLRDGQTRAGVIATAVNRRVEGTGLESRLVTSAYAGGLDLAHEFADREWKLSSSVSGSRVSGSPDAILLNQTSSRRYFQRPDAGHLTLDEGATSLAGYFAMVDLSRQAGSFQTKVAVAAVSPGYEVNDLGFQTEADRVILDTNLTYQQNTPGRVFRDWSLRGGPDAKWNYAGDRVFTDLNINANWQWVNYWGGSVRFAYAPETVDDRLTRGGPLALSPSGWSGNVNLNTDNREPYSFRGNWRWSTDEAGSWSSGVDLNMTVKAGDKWEVRLGPDFSRNHRAAQYVTRVEDPLAEATYGTRYVFAGIDQTTVALETRLNVTFSPSLSLEVFARPFLATGDYGTLMQLRAPGTFDFVRYGDEVGTVTRDPDGGYAVDPDGPGAAAPFAVSDRDFNYRSLLGNAVLRWEWSPGSTLFLVWQQSREQELEGLDPRYGTVGRSDLSRDAGDLFRLRPDNIFLVKVNYWLNP